MLNQLSKRLTDAANIRKAKMGHLPMPQQFEDVLNLSTGSMPVTAKDGGLPQGPPGGCEHEGNQHPEAAQQVAEHDRCF